jgi:phage shock protein PspC (stress-responsive transcriptional regulator)
MPSVPALGSVDVMTATLSRPRTDRVIAGVCAALARRWGWPVRRVRLLFVVSCLLPGPQTVLYIALWMMIPAERRY